MDANAIFNFSWIVNMASEPGGIDEPSQEGIFIIDPSKNKTLHNRHFYLYDKCQKYITYFKEDYFDNGSETWNSLWTILMKYLFNSSIPTFN